jgi:hypothetical protein
MVFMCSLFQLPGWLIPDVVAPGFWWANEFDQSSSAQLLYPAFDCSLGCAERFRVCLGTLARVCLYVAQQ